MRWHMRWRWGRRVGPAPLCWMLLVRCVVVVRLRLHVLVGLRLLVVLRLLVGLLCVVRC